MDEWKESFKVGQERAKIRTFPQALARAAYVGLLLAVAIWGPGRWWVRVPVCIVVALVVGAIASRRTTSGRRAKSV
jgi:hypothetical protein